MRQLVDPYAVLDLTTPWEQAWVTRWVATEYRSERGAIVELGTWLGAISRSVLRGLGDRRAEVHAYDEFRFTDIELRTAGTPLSGRHRDGTDFLDLYRQRVGPSVDRVCVHHGDIQAETWAGGPIEFLFIDVAKTWDLWRHVRATFLPALNVGAVVVQQDWAHANTPWLHIWHHRWRDHFEPLGHVGHSSSLAFGLTRPLPPEALAPDGLEDYPPDEVRAAFAWAGSLVDDAMRPNVSAARVMLHALHGDHQDALTALYEATLTEEVRSELATVAVPELVRRIVEEGA